MKPFLALVLLFLCAGCSAGLDRDQARQCRLTVAALAGEGASIRVTRQDQLDGGAGGTVIRVEYRAEDGREARPGFVQCRFGDLAERLVITALRTAEGPLSEPRLLMLNRFWLGKDEGGRHDPMPIAGTERAPWIPANTGYWMQQIVNAVPGTAIYGLLAAAYSLIYGLIGRINLAFGAFAAIGGFAGLIVAIAGGGWPVGPVLAGVALVAMSCAAFHGVAASRLVFACLHRTTGQQSLVATVGLALFLGEYLRLTQGTEPRWVVPMLDTPLALARDPSFVVTITPMVALAGATAGAMALTLQWIMRRTVFGLRWRAFRDDPGAAALFGVGRDAIFAQTFALASAMAGLAGAITVVFFGDLGSAYANALGIKALTAAVLGGIGSVQGAFLGGLFVGMAEATWSAAFPIESRDFVVFCILVGTLVLRPGGFLGFGDGAPRRV